MTSLGVWCCPKQLCDITGSVMLSQTALLFHCELLPQDENIDVGDHNEGFVERDREKKIMRGNSW